MTERLKIVLTSGGTDVPIDEVRVISNISSGTTGALIAEAALERGHEVQLLRHKHAKAPYERELKADPKAADLEKEAERVAAALKRVGPLMQNFTDRPQSEFEAYRKDLLEAVADPSVDVAVISRAASDFGVEKSDGKISSDRDGLTLNLSHLPKIISEIIPTRRNIFLVGFKFLDGSASPDQLIESAYKSLLRDKQDLSVANLGQMGTADLTTYLVTLEKGVIPVGDRENLPDLLVKTIEQRHSKRHFRTEFTKVDQLPVPEEEVNTFLDDIHKLSHLALFAEYLKDDREEFGFVAKRTSRGTLITGRGSSKSRAIPEDLALITGIDEEKRIMQVESLGIKAALNANVAQLIMEARPEVNYLLHTHVPLPEADHAHAQSSPGTAEDWERMKDLVESGSDIIYQPGHGVIMLLKDLSDVIPTLGRQNIYSERADFYDSAYARFQKNTRFLELTKALDPKGSYLDLAGGTGDLARQLIDSGFSNVSIADGAPKMLEVAKQKLPELSEDKFKAQTMEDIEDIAKYDGIFVRQAINYVSPDKLSDVFARMRRALKPNGALIFNSFRPDGLASSIKEAQRAEIGDKITITREGNLVENGIVHHGQRTEVFDVKSGSYEIVYDLNKFHIYDEQAFQKALKEGGFENIGIMNEGRSVYIKAF